MNRTRTAIANYGLTVSEIKDYLKVTTNLEDAVYSALISSSYDAVCNECSRDFISASYTTTVSGSSAEYLSFQYVDSASTGSLVNDLTGAYLYLDAPYYGDISYTVAGNSTSLPGPVKVAMMMLVSHWSENRSPYVTGTIATKLDFTIEQLLSPYKLMRP
jgi:hypothetical protein